MTVTWENAVKKAAAKKAAAKTITSKPARRFRKRYIVAALLAVSAISSVINQPTKTAVTKSVPIESVQSSPTAAELEAAQLKADGWVERANGIYTRWCDDNCEKTRVSGDSWVRMEVWAKDRTAGDIYARVNLLRDEVVIGWTNDTLYLDKGARCSHL